MGWHYRRNWECILVAQKSGASCKWYGGNDIPNLINDCPKIIPQKTDHPTPKPPELMQKFISYHSQINEIVLDPFMGGGTTLVAAKNLRRKAIGIELEEKYCEMAAKRLMQEVLEF